MKNNICKTTIIMLQLVSHPLFASYYQCDHNGDLTQVPRKELTSKNSIEYTKSFDLNYNEQENSIQKLKAKVKTPEKVRETYFDAKIGKRSLAKLEKIKSAFSYDRIDRLMIDDSHLITPKINYTHTFKVENKIYYLNNYKIVAIAEQKSDESIIVMILNKNCDLKNIFHLNDLNPQSDSAIESKITPELCNLLRTTSNPKPEDIELTDGFFPNSDEAEFTQDKKMALTHTQELCNNFSTKKIAPKREQISPKKTQ